MLKLRTSPASCPLVGRNRKGAASRSRFRLAVQVFPVIFATIPASFSDSGSGDLGHIGYRFEPRARPASPPLADSGLSSAPTPIGSLMHNRARSAQERSLLRNAHMKRFRNFAEFELLNFTNFDESDAEIALFHSSRHWVASFFFAQLQFLAPCSLR